MRITATVSLALAIALTACSWHHFKTDQVLIDGFFRHQEQFSELLSMAEVDQGFGRIHNGLPPFGMSEERGSMYRALFSALGVQIGMNRYPQYPGAVFLLVDAESWPDGATIKGYAYCKCRLGPEINNLDSQIPASLKDSDQKHFIVFRSLTPTWYIFREFSNASLHTPR